MQGMARVYPEGSIADTAYGRRSRSAEAGHPKSWISIEFYAHTEDDGRVLPASIAGEVDIHAEASTSHREIRSSDGEHVAKVFPPIVGVSRACW